VFEIGASQQHRGQTRRHSEARKLQEELVLVLVGDVDLRKVLHKRGLNLLLAVLAGVVQSAAALKRARGVSGCVARACMRVCPSGRQNCMYWFTYSTRM